MLPIKNNRLSIFLVCFILGFLLAVQFHTISNRYQQGSNGILNTWHGKTDRRNTVKEKIVANTQQATITSLIEAGSVPVEGPGVVLTIMDSSRKMTVPDDNQNFYVVHDEDMLKIINELRAAGAEAISINGQRMVATTEIRCAGPTISVNNTRSAPPFIVSAIGNPDTLENALKMRGGIVETLGVWGIKVDIKKESLLKLPAYQGNMHFKYAKPLK